MELKEKLSEAAAVLKVLEKYTPKHEGVSIDVVVSFDGKAEMRLFEDATGDYGLATY